MNKLTKELNKINNKLDKKVHAENDEAYTDMICYLRGANITEYNQEKIRYDLLEMILSAQQRGEDIQTVIGNDYKVFCDEVIANVPAKSKKENFLYILDLVCIGISILLTIKIIFSQQFISLIKNLLSGKPVNLGIPVTLGDILSYSVIIVLATVFVQIFCKNAFKISNKKTNKLKTGFITYAVSLVLLTACILPILLLTKSLFIVNIFVLLAVALAFFIMHKVFSRI